jgi:hypothetical protein
MQPYLDDTEKMEVENRGISIGKTGATSQKQDFRWENSLHPGFSFFCEEAS